MNSEEDVNTRTKRSQDDGAHSSLTRGQGWRLGAAFAVFAVIIGACSGGSGGGQGTFQGSSGGGGFSSGGTSGGSGGSGAGNAEDGGAGASSSGSGSGGGSGSGSGATGSSSGGGSSGASGSGSGVGSSSNGSSGGSDGGSSGAGSGGKGTMGCGQTLPAITDYTQNGPFTATTVDNTGPDGGYTVVQPMMLGQNGFKHPVATWGNGITTTPSLYPTLLNRIASNGIVVVASNSSSVTTDDMTGGLDWMIQQNTASGPYQGMLDTSCLIAIGYSLGGGAAVGAGAHANIVTTVSFHGVTGNSAGLKTPLLLFTSTTDTFVTASGFVTPTYNASVVQTFYATLTDAGDPNNSGHLLPVSPTDPEYAPALAWLRLWVYGDQGGRSFFYGSGATLCQSPWTCQSKEPGGASQMSGF
jgi:hypothetical protein